MEKPEIGYNHLTVVPKNIDDDDEKDTQSRE